MNATGTTSEPLRRGDIVEVRSPAEILATLDDGGALHGVPFMPEMLAFTGKRFAVSSRVEKICDTVRGGRSRSLRMHDTVLLEDLRCHGSAHGGCQAGCRIYWNEAWLRRVDGHDSEPLDDAGRAELERVALAATRRDAETFRCQATDALLASEPLGTFDVRQYVRELTSGNVGPAHLVRVWARAMWTTIGRRLRLLPWQPLSHSGAPITPRTPLGLQAGDLVQVRPRGEISKTLDERGRNRGLSFDWEMLPHCGGTYRVQDRVERIIDERTGRMIELTSDCLILEGVVCSGDHSAGRWFCPRAIYPFWREAWLQRCDPDTADSAP